MAASPQSQPTPPESGRIDRLRNRAQKAKEQGMSRLEVERARRPSVRLAFQFYEQDRAFAGSLLAGGIAFRLFLWVLPFSLVLIVLLGALADGLDRPTSELAQDAGLTVALAALVEEAVADSTRARIYLGILGVVLLIWTGIGVARALRLVSRLSWEMVSAPQMKPLNASLAVIAVVLGTLGLQWAANRLQSGPFVVDVLVLIGAGLALIAIMAWLFNALPHPSAVTWTAMVPGAVLVTLGFLIVRLVTIVYFSRRLESADDLYGGLGLAAVFLAWLYIVGRTLVASISLNATLWRGRAAPGTGDT